MGEDKVTSSFDNRPIDSRLGPYLVDTIAATATLDETIGALTLAYDAMCREAGRNETLAHAFCSMRLVII
jgi:hypothetical protein